VRRWTQQIDILHAARIAPKNNTEATVALLRLSMATTFTKHVLDMAPVTLPGTLEGMRHNASIERAAPFVGHVLIETMKIVKQLEGR
jgi:hypothetical protein